MDRDREAAADRLCRGSFSAVLWADAAVVGAAVSAEAPEDFPVAAAEEALGASAVLAAG